jgi:hypothetical protein
MLGPFTRVGNELKRYSIFASVLLFLSFTVLYFLGTNINTLAIIFIVTTAFALIALLVDFSLLIVRLFTRWGKPFNKLYSDTSSIELKDFYNQYIRPFYGDLLSSTTSHFSDPVFKTDFGIPFRAWLRLYDLKLINNSIQTDKVDYRTGELDYLLIAAIRFGELSYTENHKYFARDLGSVLRFIQNMKPSLNPLAASPEYYLSLVRQEYWSHLNGRDRFSINIELRLRNTIYSPLIDFYVNFLFSEPYRILSESSDGNVVTKANTVQQLCRLLYVHGIVYTGIDSMLKDIFYPSGKKLSSDDSLNCLFEEKGKNQVFYKAIKAGDDSPEGKIMIKALRQYCTLDIEQLFDLTLNALHSLG